MRTEEIEKELVLLRRYLKTPRMLESIKREFGWTRPTAQRRMRRCGYVWRVSVHGGRNCSYVYMPKWGVR